MKYIDKFANIDAFLNSELRNITGDRVAVIEGFDLPILKKKLKMVVDPSTNEEVEELQDVWMVPVGQEEKKVEHNFEVIPTKAIFYFSSGNGVKNYSLVFTPNDFNNIFRDNNRPMNLDYSKLQSSRRYDSPIGDFVIDKFGTSYTQLVSRLKDAIYPTDGQVVDVPFSLRYDGSWREFVCHAAFAEFDTSNVVLNTSMTLSPGSTIEIASSVGTGRIVQSTGNSDIDKFKVSDITYTTAQGNDALTYNSQYITLPSTQHSCGYDIQGTVILTPFILDDAAKIGSAVEGNSITMPLSLHVNVLASGDIPFEFDSFDASVTYQEPVESGEVITFELDLNETQDRDLSSYTVTGNSLLVSSYVGTTGGKVLVTMTIPNNVEDGVEYSTGDTITISNSRGYSYNFSVTYNYVGKQTTLPTNAVLVLGTMTDMSDNSATLNIANGTAGNAGASSKNFNLVRWITDGNGNLLSVNGSQYLTIDVNDVDVSVSSNPSGAGYSVQKLSSSIDVYFGDQNTSSNNANKSVEYTITFTYGELSLSYTVDVDWGEIITENEPDRSSDGEGYRGNTTIKKVIVSEGVTSLGESAFNGCTNLEEVTLPSTLTRLGLGCFIGTKITSITIPNGCRGNTDDPNNTNYGHLGYGTFMNCTSLTSVSIPSTITAIDALCFKGCTNLTSITLPNSITNIAAQAFDGTGLTSIEIPKNCTYDSSSFPSGCTVTRAPAE